MKIVLGDKVKEVCVIFCLIDFLVCLVVDENELLGNLVCMLKVVGQVVLEFKFMLEINLDYLLVQCLKYEEVCFDDWLYILYDQVLLVEGGVLVDLVSFVKCLNDMLLVMVVK